jgi:hypothetical protein
MRGFRNGFTGMVDEMEDPSMFWFGGLRRGVKDELAFEGEGRFADG